MVNFTLSALNQVFTLGVSGELAAEAPVALDVSAVAVFRVKLSDMLAVFKFQSDSIDVNDISASDIKYYVYRNAWPANLKLNPVHADLSVNPILPTAGDIDANKNLVKHDFVRYLAQQLFNTPHGVDLFSNEEALLADLVSKGATARAAIETALDSVNQSSNSLSLEGSSPHRYATNALTGATNICRELLRQVASQAPARFHGIADQTTVQSVPLAVNDTLNFKVSITAAANQHALTDRTNPFDTRVYKIQLVLTADNGAAPTVPVEAGTTTEYPYHS